MPNSYIKKLVKDGKGSIEDLESKWNKAKDIALKNDHSEDYPYIMGIFKNMIGESYSFVDFLSKGDLT